MTDSIDNYNKAIERIQRFNFIREELKNNMNQNEVDVLNVQQIQLKAADAKTYRVAKFDVGNQITKQICSKCGKDNKVIKQWFTLNKPNYYSCGEHYWMASVGFNGIPKSNNFNYDFDEQDLTEVLTNKKMETVD